MWQHVAPPGETRMNPRDPSWPRDPVKVKVTWGEGLVINHEEGGYNTGGGGIVQVKFYTPKMGSGKVSAMLKGGTQRFEVR